MPTRDVQKGRGSEETANAPNTHTAVIPFSY